MVETCSNVTSQYCDSPANLEPPRAVRGRCFACGLPVCGPCSQIVEWKGYGRKRVCDNCLYQEGGDAAARVVRKEFRQAGYDLSLNGARREAAVRGVY